MAKAFPLGGIWNSMAKAFPLGGKAFPFGESGAQAPREVTVFL